MVRRLVRDARHWWRAGLAVLSLVVMSAFSVSAQAPKASDLGQIFKDHDRNSDRTLDREEFQRVIVEAFFFRDRDKDGYLVITELTELSADGFRAADRDGDGRLSLQEYVNALFKDFDSADRDQDGVLTYEELEIYIRTTRR
ncbi:MAG TPA: EF-hand domain-containing protein [Bryobacteraceae bacterium]|jgi:Ca2+-binding EF-hand superfamily protein